MINNVLFDLDGTLLDTSEGILESVRYTASVLNLNPISDDKLHMFIGPPLTWSFSNLYGCNEDEACQATIIFRQYYQDGALLKAKVYDGIVDLCSQLKELGIRTAVATNKPDRFANQILSHFCLSQYFDFIHGADENGSLKKADLINICLNDLDAARDESVLIGDTINDAKGAEAARIPFLAVTYGFGFQKEDEIQSCNCIDVANSPSAILHKIMKGRVL